MLIFKVLVYKTEQSFILSCDGAMKACQVGTYASCVRLDFTASHGCWNTIFLKIIFKNVRIAQFCAHIQNSVLLAKSVT